jgi:NitT/TauT family transport system substrate-binding protein
MQTTHNRRRFLATLSSAGAAALVGVRDSRAQEAPPETTTIRLAKHSGICNAPQFIADALLRAEGFTDIRYVETIPGVETTRSRRVRLHDELRAAPDHCDRCRGGDHDRGW